MTEPQQAEHVGVRPSWRCKVCRRPWPCEPAKEVLLAEFREFPSVLCIYMSSQMQDALDDLTAKGGKPPYDLYDRFIGWIGLATDN